jgi:hypothetical protein
VKGAAASTPHHRTERPGIAGHDVAISIDVAAARFYHAMAAIDASEPPTSSGGVVSASQPGVDAFRSRSRDPCAGQEIERRTGSGARPTVAS